MFALFCQSGILTLSWANAHANADQAKLRIVYVCFSPIRLALRILALGMPAKQSKAKQSKAKQRQIKPSKAKPSQALHPLRLLFFVHSSFYFLFRINLLPNIKPTAKQAKQSKANQTKHVVLLNLHAWCLKPTCLKQSKQKPNCEEKFEGHNADIKHNAA